MNYQIFPASSVLRYITSHPRDMNAELIAAHRDNGKLMPLLASADTIGFGSYFGAHEPQTYGARIY